MQQQKASKRDFEHSKNNVLKLLVAFVATCLSPGRAEGQESELLGLRNRNVIHHHVFKKVPFAGGLELFLDGARYDDLPHLNSVLFNPTQGEAAIQKGSALNVEDDFKSATALGRLVYITPLQKIMIGASDYSAFSSHYIGDETYSIDVCGNPCTIDTDAQDADEMTYNLPQVSTAYCADTFQIVTERILSEGTWTGTACDEELAQLIDGKNMVDMNDSTSSNCYFQVQLQENHVGALDEVKFFIDRLQNNTPFQENLFFQGSDDGLTFADLQAINKSVHEGCNSLDFEQEGEIPSYIIYRFQGIQSGSCRIGEVKLQGVESIDDDQTSHFCTAKLTIWDSLTLINTVFFDENLNSVLRGMSTRFSSVHPLSAKYLEAICEDRTQEFDFKSFLESESEDLKLQLPLMLSQMPQSSNELPFSNRVVIDKPIPLKVAMAKLPRLMALVFIVVKAMLLLLTLMAAIANKSRARKEKPTLSSRPRQHWLVIGMALLFADHLSLVKAEESSIMAGATVPTELWAGTPSGDVLINGSFKSFLWTLSRTNPIDLDVTLSQTERLQTVVLVASAKSDQASADYIGDSEIVLVNGSTEVVSKSGVWDTGVYTLETPAEAASIRIRRQSGPAELGLAHVRAYQSTNLMQYATVHYETPSVVGNEAQNLINNPESRSSSNSWNARASAQDLGAGGKADYKSCYVTNQTEIVADGNQVKLVFDFGVVSFIHAILMLDDFNDDDSWVYLSAADKKNYFQNASLWVGNDSEVATNNAPCQESPFLDINDASNYFADPRTTNSENLNLRPWKYGHEQWCNKEGRYLHVVATPADLTGSFSQSLCTLAALGTIYKRDSELASSLVVHQGQTGTTITVPHIYADTTKPITNTLDIILMQTSSLSVTITRDSTESTIDTSQLAVGTHELIMDSYDDNSSVKSVLKTDTIQIVVITVPDAPTSLVEVSVTKTEASFSWTAPSDDGGDPVIDYTIEMDGVEVATGITSTSYTKTGLNTGTSYVFSVKAKNSVGNSLQSSAISILAVTVPSQPSAPTTSIGGFLVDPTVIIDWIAPSDDGGLTITGYNLEIKTSKSTFENEITFCNAESDGNIISGRSCTIPVATLRAAPFDLGESASVTARVTAINSLGESIVSEEGSGASIPLLIKPSFAIEPETKILKLGQLTEWILPAIDDGTFPPVEVEYTFDSKIAFFFKFDSDSHTITFDGQGGEELVDQVFVSNISLVDSESNVVSYSQNIEILQADKPSCERRRRRRQADIEGEGENSKADIVNLEAGDESIEEEPDQTCEEPEEEKEVSETKTDSKEQTGEAKQQTSQVQKETSQVEEETSQVEEETTQDEEKIPFKVFKFEWKPSVNLQSEEAFDSFAESLSELKSLAEDEVKNGGKPLEARVGLLNSSGLAEIIFTEAMEFPEDLNQLIFDSQGDKDALMEISLIEPENKVSTNIKSWSLESISPTKITVKIEYFFPLKVSQDEIADQMYFHIRLSQWKDAQGRQLPELIVKSKEVPRQVASLDEAENVADAGTTGATSASVVGPVNTASMMFVQTSLSQLWAVLNCQQVVLTMPLMKNVKFPANALIFTDSLSKIANLDLFPTEFLEDLVYYLPEPVAFNINFAANGIKSTLFISNIGSSLLIILAYLIAAIMCLVLFQVKWVWTWLRPILYWNGLIRLFLELYQDLSLLSFLNIYTAEWDSVYSSVRFSNNLAAAVFGVIISVPIILAIVLYCKRNQWKDEKFEQRFGSLLEGTNGKPPAAVVFLIFLLRRLAVVMSVVAMQEFVWGQIALQVFFSVGNLIFIQWFQPLDSKFANTLETINEVCILMLSYLAICFTEFVPDPEMRNYLGLYFIGFNGTMIAFHLILLLWNTFKACKQSRKKKKFEKNKKEHQAKKLAIEQAKAANDVSQQRVKISGKKLKIVKKKSLDMIEEENSDDNSIESQVIEKENQLDISSEQDENQIVEEPQRSSSVATTQRNLLLLEPTAKIQSGQKQKLNKKIKSQGLPKQTNQAKSTLNMFYIAYGAADKSKRVEKDQDIKLIDSIDDVFGNKKHQSQGKPNEKVETQRDSRLIQSNSNRLQKFYR